jgi:hypothetical protein
LVIHILAPLSTQSSPFLLGRVFILAGIGAAMRFGQAEAADDFATPPWAAAMLFLLFRAEGMDGVHAQRGLHRDETAQAGIAALQLLADQAVS